MPRKRKRGAELGCRQKHYTKGKSHKEIFINHERTIIPKDTPKEILTQIRHAKNNNYNDFHSLHESHIVDPNEFITSRRERYDENEDNENFSGGKLKIRSKNDHSYEWRQRLAIAHIYESMFSLENRDKWSKRHGTIYKIRKVLGLNRGAHTLIKNVLENVSYKNEECQVDFYCVSNYFDFL